MSLCNCCCTCLFYLHRSLLTRAGPDALPCSHAQIMVSVSERQMRPDIPGDPEQLQGGTFDGWDAYTGLLQRCWAQEPAARPTFDIVIAELRELLSESASLSRQRRMSEPPAQQQGTPGAQLLGERSAPATAAGTRSLLVVVQILFRQVLSPGMLFSCSVVV